MPKKKSKTSSSFLTSGNRNLTPREWKLFVGFLVAVVAFLFYTLVLNNKSYVANYTPVATPIDNTLVVLLSPQNKSGETGKAVFTQNGSKTMVSLIVSGTPKGVAQFSQIHSGTCAKLGTLKYSLNSLVGGKSTTTLPVSLAQIKTQLPLAVTVSKSAAASTSSVSCGPID